VSFRPLSRQDGGINAFSIIPDTEPELLIVVADFYLDLPRLRMAEGVPQSFSGNSVDFVAQDGMQISWPAFDVNAKCRRSLVGRVGGQFFSNGIYGPREVVVLNGGFA
jgi:hypothetical protein